MGPHHLIFYPFIGLSVLVCGILPATISVTDINAQNSFQTLVTLISANNNKKNLSGSLHIQRCKFLLKEKPRSSGEPLLLPSQSHKPKYEQRPSIKFIFTELITEFKEYSIHFEIPRVEFGVIFPFSNLRRKETSPALPADSLIKVSQPAWQNLLLSPHRAHHSLLQARALCHHLVQRFTTSSLMTYQSLFRFSYFLFTQRPGIPLSKGDRGVAVKGSLSLVRI